MASVDIMQFTSVENVAAEVDKKWDYIIGSLTTNGPELEKLAEIPFKMDKVAPAENGLLPLADKIVVDDAKLVEPGCYMEEIMDFFNDEHICDGLPIIPPTKARYEKMMEYCPWDENTVLTDPTGPAGKGATVKDVAIAAIMAGCKPQAMPILVAAFKALNSPLYNLNQSLRRLTRRKHGPCVRPDRTGNRHLGKQGCMGPGWPMNATIGRAVNLVVMNIFRSVPGICDLDCLASQAEFTYCFAEDPELAQWNMINEDRFDSRRPPFIF
jgi:hypothetical protein